jgi:L-threonylcarbamoyladenylate synthase
VQDVDDRLRAGVDVLLDGGELPGTPSTVVDLTGFHEDGSFRVVREGAMRRERLTAVLRSSR